MQPVAGATGKRFDELGGRRLQTRLGGAKLCLARAGRICPDLCASRLVRSTATHCDGPLDLEPNPPRQNGSNLRLDALIHKMAPRTAGYRFDRTIRVTHG